MAILTTSQFISFYQTLTTLSAKPPHASSLNFFSNYLFKTLNQLYHNESFDLETFSRAVSAVLKLSLEGPYGADGKFVSEYCVKMLEEVAKNKDAFAELMEDDYVIDVMKDTLDAKKSSKQLFSNIELKSSRSLSDTDPTADSTGSIMLDLSSILDQREGLLKIAENAPAFPQQKAAYEKITHVFLAAIKTVLMRIEDEDKEDKKINLHKEYHFLQQELLSHLYDYAIFVYNYSVNPNTPAEQVPELKQTAKNLLIEAIDLMKVIPALKPNKQRTAIYIYQFLQMLYCEENLIKQAMQCVKEAALLLEKTSRNKEIAAQCIDNVCTIFGDFINDINKKIFWQVDPVLAEESIKISNDVIELGQQILTVIREHSTDIEISKNMLNTINDYIQFINSSAKMDIKNDAAQKALEKYQAALSIANEFQLRSAKKQEGYVMNLKVKIYMAGGVHAHLAIPILKNLLERAESENRNRDVRKYRYDLADTLLEWCLTQKRYYKSKEDMGPEYNSNLKEIKVLVGFMDPYDKEVQKLLFKLNTLEPKPSPFGLLSNTDSKPKSGEPYHLFKGRLR